MHFQPISEPADSSGLDPKNDDDFAELVRLHHRDLLVYAQALSRDQVAARDIVQEAFIAAYVNGRTFDMTRDFATWMRGIVRNKWREWLRKNRRYLYSEDVVAAIDAEISAWQARRAAGGTDLFEALEICLERLPENLKSAIQATYFEGRTSEEAAATLGIPAAAVRKRLQRAREAIKQCLAQKL